MRGRITAVMRGRVTVAVAGAAGCVLVWQLASALGLPGPGLIPAPVVVARRIGALAADPAFRTAAAVTGLTWLVAMAVTVAIAVPAGLLVGAVPVARAATGTAMDLIRPIPAVALIPPATVLLGAGPAMSITLATLAGVWPNLVYGLASVEPLMVDTARGFGHRPWRIAAQVRLPSVLPALLIGVRLASAIELVVIVSVDFLTGGGDGLGAYLYAAGEQAGDLTTVLAGVLVVGAGGMRLKLGLAGRRRPWFDHTGAAATPPRGAGPGGRYWAGLGWVTVGVGVVAWQLAATAA